MKCYIYQYQTPSLAKQPSNINLRSFVWFSTIRLHCPMICLYLLPSACYWPYCTLEASKRRVKSQCPWIEIQADGWVALCHGWLSNCIEDVDLVLSMWCQRTFLGTRRCLWQVRHAEIAPNKSENSGSLQMTSGWRLDRSKRYFAGLQTLRLRCRGCNVFFSFFMRFPNA